MFNGEIVDQLPFHRQKFNIFTRLVLLSPLGKQQLRAQLITHESFMSRDRVIFNRKGFTEVQCIIRTSWCANSKEVKLRLITILSIFNAIWHIDFKYLRFFVSILFAKHTASVYHLQVLGSTKGQQSKCHVYITSGMTAPTTHLGHLKH